MTILKTLDDLWSYTEQNAKDAPSIANHIVITNVGLPKPIVSDLASELDLPPIYQRCIETLGLCGVSIGFFALWPGSGGDKNLAESLLERNRSLDEPAVEKARLQGLVAVAREEGDLICVGKGLGERPDVVFLLEASLAPGIRTIEMAWNFEQFLILAGNHYAISFEFEGRQEEGLRQMVECCNYFRCSALQALFWENEIAQLLA